MKRKALLLPFFALLCFFGFQKGDRFQENKARWTGNEGGIRFEPNSMVWGKGLFEGAAGSGSPFSLELTLQPLPAKPLRFGVILQIYNPSSRQELTLGQWGNSLVVLGSDDYSNSRRHPKIYGDLGSSGGERRVRIDSGDKGTFLYIDEVLRGQNANLLLSLPSPREDNLLILGNGKHGKSPWSGELGEIRVAGLPVIDFRGSIPSRYPRLSIPPMIRDLHPGFLRMPELSSPELRYMSLDILLNFFGFLPFGYLLFVNLGYRKRPGPAVTFAVAVLASFLFSLSIETAQTVIPGRDSSLLDLILNTAGGFTGAALGLWGRLRRLPLGAEG